jgi:hypothetical protein
VIFVFLHFQWSATIENGGTSVCRRNLCLLQRFLSEDHCLRALVEPERVHGTLYSDPAVFQVELQKIWAATWG